ncbi:Cysteine desulfurase SufS [Rubrobacter xylanophilus DSM 9941]|uniref:cysteine desulfurase-like protein n=1 Tax=Rubrobacter xylanophilus TaxID=49319 RepID=UPI001C640D48|nr:cysteine desulfurase-like protein [Rubrobacter xylanophilus]QYJ15926.1 Cysteine desulfurase SufS [Rubrobacter xylanophilus DSM 9941]
MHKTFDVEAVREEFPALGRKVDGCPAVYLDGPGGSQVARSAIEAVAGYMERGGANLHGAFATSVETEEIIAGARAAAAALLGAEAEEVAFGQNMTTLTFALSRALAREWGEGDGIVVTELDHRANVDPWLLAAADRGAKVRWLRVDTGTLTLDLSDLEEKVNERTRLVAVGLASNAVGTVNEVAEISRRAHEVGAVVAVDAVHAAPHIPIDRDALGADIISCSAYKFFGPHVGIVAVRRPLFERLAPYKVEPAPDSIPDKLETGTQNHEGIAGVKGAIDFVASLGSGGSLRERVLSGMAAIEEHEDSLAAELRAGLRELPGLTLYAAPEETPKTPTFAFRMENHTPREVCARLAREGIFAADGDFYASTLAVRLGLQQSGGFVRVGLAPYNTREEVQRLLRALAGLARG